MALGLNMRAKAPQMPTGPGPAQMAAPAGAGPARAPQIDVSKMNIPKMLQEKLHLTDQALQQLMDQLKSAKTPQDATRIIKEFDRNPATMNQPYTPGQGSQQAPQGQAPQALAPAGLPIAQGA